MAECVTKFYVANIPDGCRPWDLATLLSSFGNLAGSYIARKRSKEGLKFGFVSFKGVKDWKELEGRLQGLNLGGFKLKINRAKFAKEKTQAEELHVPSDTTYHTSKNVRQAEEVQAPQFDAFTNIGRSYCSVLKNNGAPNQSSSNSAEQVKEVTVHNETSAFFDLQGRSVVDRTKDLDSLINLRVSLKEAGIDGFKLYYLGGFYLLLTFEDEVDATDFLLNTNLWRDWFSLLDLWSGQSLAYERIAWIKFHGVPLNLAENKVFDDMASLFGKVVKSSQLSPRDWDLSSNIVGILVDAGARVSGQVTLKWKSKSFRVWVMEELDDWVPDSLFEEVWPDKFAGISDEAHALDSSVGDSESRATEQSKSDLGMHEFGDSEASGKVVSIPVAGVNPSYASRDYTPNNEENTGFNSEDYSNVDPVGVNANSPLCGSFGPPFVSTGSGPRPNPRKIKLRPKRRGSKSAIKSPVSIDRPKKRPRSSSDDYDPFDLNRFLNLGTFKTKDTVDGSVQQEEKSDNNGTCKSGGSLDLNISIHSTILDADQANLADGDLRSANTDDGDGEGLSEHQIDDEVNATVAVGAVIGVHLDHFGSLVKDTIRNEGISGCHKANWVRDLRLRNSISAIALQESKQESVSESSLANFWGSGSFEFDFAGSVGLSGGLIWLWDPSVLKVNSVSKARFFLIISGTLVGSGDKLNLINIYAPQGSADKKQLWDDLSNYLAVSVDQWVLCADFNTVRPPLERKNSKFKPSCARYFNDFIFNHGLLEYPMQGRNFTCVRENGKKLSKIDRFLVNNDFFSKWPDACVRALSCLHSDHCPILLSVINSNFGARPFRVFSSWFGRSGFDEAVYAAVKDFQVSGPPDSVLSKKFCRIREFLKK
ncbi:putative RNA recognition motif domain, nucleotide-binding alpha-beta plait domain superfamily [Helianthus annuus]|nr:putative RNA recognition motif domain, nucleotide-binding alpha-beta plait domain superfamily [Helianthus annuus]